MMAWLRSPEFADKAQALGAMTRYATGLPKRQSEMAILITSQHWSCEYEWSIHSVDAANAGLEKEIIDGIRQGRTPRFIDPKDEILFRYSRELHEQKGVSQATFDAAMAAFGERTVVELTLLLGYYTLMAMTINAFQVKPGD
jgi:4-carboxymuconolactone decarboxylase